MTYRRLLLAASSRQQDRLGLWVLGIGIVVLSLAITAAIVGMVVDATTPR